MWGVLKNLMKVVLVEPDVTEDDVNVLLFGNSGTGNSTVINSIWNYFKYPIFRAARGNIETVTHDSEVYSVDEGLKVYKLPIKMDLKTFNLILIDTPPVGNPRGIEQDNTNMENILGYLATLKKLHAVCFVFKAHETRVTKFMEYCLKQMLTRLDRSAKEDIIFITVYNETSRYTAEETKHHCLVPLVRGIRSNPPRIRIGLNNVFALDNEAFRALLKIQEGKRYNRHELDGFAQSWETSSKEIRRLLTYITTLESLDLQNIISINEVRFLVEQLATCISEISERIQDNMKSLDTHQKRLTTEDQLIQQLKPQLYTTCVGLEVKKLTQPATICTNPKCTEVVTVAGVKQCHYKQCHSPCYLPGNSETTVGDLKLRFCSLMLNDKCKHCGCAWQFHMNTCNVTQKKEFRKEDEMVKDAIKSKEDSRSQIEKLVADLNKQNSELEEEAETISRIIARFSYFLQKHAILPFNDAYNDLIKQRIKNEKDLENSTNPEMVGKLEKLLSQHQARQKIVQESTRKFQNEARSRDLTLQTIMNCICRLYRLKHMGKTIQELTQTSSICRYEEAQENFSLDETIAEDQYQKTDDSEHDDEVNTSNESDNSDEPVIKVTYTYLTNDSSSTQRLRQNPSPQRHGNRLIRKHSFRRYRNPEEYPPTEKKSHRRHLDHSPDDRDFRKSSSDNDSDGGHFARSFDRKSSTKRSQKQHHDRSRKSDRGKNDSFRQPRDSEEYYRRIEKKTRQRARDEVEHSPRRHRHRNDSYVSNDHDPIKGYSARSKHSRHEDRSDTESSKRSKNYESGDDRSTKLTRSRRRSGDETREDHSPDDRDSRRSSTDNGSDGDHFARSFDRRSSTKRSQKQHHDRSRKSDRSKNYSFRQPRDSEENYRRIEKKTRQRARDEVEDSPRRHRHRNDSYVSSDHDSIKGYTAQSKHSGHEDRSDTESLKQSKNYDSGDDRPTKLTRSRRRSGDESRDPGNKLSTRSSGRGQKQTESKTRGKSSQRNESFRGERSTKRGPKTQKKPKSGDES